VNAWHRPGFFPVELLDDEAPISNLVSDLQIDRDASYG
jgi:hypothetical protein